MRKLFQFTALSLYAWAGADGQQLVTSQPDCQIFFHFTMAGSTSPTSPNSGLDNRTLGCDTWNVTYSNSGFSVISLALQGAANVAGAPAAYANNLSVQQTVLAGSNPQTNTTGGFLWLTGYSPWVRMTLGSSTGSGVVDGAAYGWKIPSAGVSSTATQDVNVTKWGGTSTTLGQKAMAASVPMVIASDQSAVPVSLTGNQAVNLAQVAGTNTVTGGLAGSQGVGGLAASGAALTGNPIPLANLDSGGNVRVPDYCTLKATFAFVAGSGNVQLVAVSTTTTIRVCHVDFEGDTLSAFKLVTGTGSTCTSSADETGTMTGPGGGIFGFSFDYTSALPTTAAKTLCLNSSASTTGGGTITYSQR